MKDNRNFESYVDLLKDHLEDNYNTNKIRNVLKKDISNSKVNKNNNSNKIKKSKDV